MKFSDKARKVISAVAPSLGAALGGPLGGLAGNLIADAVGGADNVEAALLAQRPEILQQLKAAEQAYLLELKRLGIEEDRIHLADRADARALAAIDMRPQVWLSIFFIAGYFLMFAGLLGGWLTIPDGKGDVYYALIGVVTVGVTTIMQFWFGSSHGSARKTGMLGKEGA